MIRMIQIKSAAHAEDYFNDALSQTDYYLNGQELGGQFKGKIANRLGLSVVATEPVFHALCNNTNPITDKPLTLRTTENRTIYYDINFHVPKSVSIALLIKNDENILSAFQESVQETMLDIEADGQTRIRKNGQNENRLTKELLWADFVHFTARPVDDDTFPDPHLHSHCTTFNVTWDETEQQYKAGQFRDIKRDMPYYQECYYKRLSDRLIGLGYDIRRTETAFEIANVSPQLIDLFSKRTQDVNRIAKENNITGAEKLDQLGAKTRSKKKKSLSLGELKKDWNRQISELSTTGKEGKLKTSGSKKVAPSITAQQCIDHALMLRFERASVAHDRRILASAYRYGLGHPNITLAGVNHSFRQDKRIISIQDGLKRMCTTQEVLAEEKRMVDLAEAGKGQCVPLYGPALPELTVTGDQAAAITHVLTSTDRVAIVKGGAGTGKTSTLTELVKHIRHTGIEPVLVAPTANASRGVMREEGFANADTVARLLIEPDKQAELESGLLIVDEAGLLGVKDMLSLLQLVTKKNARLILFGDTRQHASVIRGDALRILNTVAGIKAAEINKIYRQRHDCYRKAVEDISNGNIQSAFQRLDDFNAITEVETDSLNVKLVDSYMAATSNGKTALVVSPTHVQCETLSLDIRNALKEKGVIGQKDVTVTRYINLNYTEAEKSDPRMYQPSLAVQFNQNLRGVVRGSIWQVKEIEEERVIIADEDNKTMPLPLNKSNQFTVYRKTEIPLAIGDAVQITRGAFDSKGKRLNNGQSLKVAEIKDSQIILSNPDNSIEYDIANNFGHIRHGYTTTSHTAQGRTIDEVFIAQPASTFSASNMKQFYVSVSRARDNVHIYTDDKSELMKQVSEIGDRQSAIELLGVNDLEQYIAMQPSLPRRPLLKHLVIEKLQSQPQKEALKPYVLKLTP